MSSLLGLLSNTASGLAAHRAVTQTASHNIANVSTPGYTRQRVGLEARKALSQGGGPALGNGVRARGISAARDQFVEAQLPPALSSAAFADAESAVLTSVTQLSPELPSGIPVQLGAFYGSLRELSENPASISHRTAFLESARGLSGSLQRASDEIAAKRSAADKEVEANLPEINDLLANIGRLNLAIRAARSPDSVDGPSDLLDQQQRAVDELAELVGGNPTRDAAGNLSLTLPNGASLVSATDYVQFRAEPDPNNDAFNKLIIEPAGGGVAREVPAAELGGKLGGLMAARDGALLRASDDLDAFAWELGNRINDLHRTGFGLDGSTGIDLFEVPAQKYAARDLRVNDTLLQDPAKLGAADTITAGSGDNKVVLAMLATEGEPLGALGGPPGTVVGDAIGRYGSLAKRALSAAEAEAVARDFLVGMRDSISGVSVDEELIEITKAQRAFEAMSKVADTSNRMLETILNLK